MDARRRGLAKLGSSNSGVCPEFQAAEARFFELGRLS